MRTRLLVLLLLTAVLQLHAQNTTGSNQSVAKPTPADLVQQQVAGYNARDIEAFLAPYTDSVELYSFPDKLISKGKEAMRKSYAGFFARMPRLHCEIMGRQVQGNTVVDKEKVTGAGDKPLEAIAIYQIENNKIKRVYFVE